MMHFWREIIYAYCVYIFFSYILYFPIDGFNNYRSSMDVASDDYDNIIDERQDNTLQSSIELVKNVNTCSQDTHVQIQMNTSAVRATNEHVTTRDTLIRLKQHKWSLLAFICGVILTLGIVVPVMMSKSSPMERGIIIIFIIHLTCLFYYLNHI